MAYWQNWSGRQVSKPDLLSFVRSERDAVALVNQCAADNKTIRVAGAGHSHSPLVINEDVVVDVSGLSGVLDVDVHSQQAWIRAGSHIFSLGIQLHEHGLALKNQGDIDRQLLSGAVSTGTHGTGKDLKNISASVTSLELILASGDVVRCSPGVESELFEVARLSLGAVGLITKIQMQLRESNVIREKGWTAEFDDIHGDIENLIAGNERFEFFWYPGTDEVVVKTINETSDLPVYPLAEEGKRHAYSFEVLPSHRPVPHTEMEYSIPLEAGPACFAEIRRLLVNDFPAVKWPVEYRTVAADDIWLSMAFGRPTVTISVHQDVKEDEESYYRACEEIFLSYGGRPHWGKVNYLTADQLSRLYAHWEDWWHIRNRYDPSGVFLNDYLRHIQP